MHVRLLGTVRLICESWVVDLGLLSLGSETKQMVPMNMPFKEVTDALIGVTKRGQYKGKSLSHTDLSLQNLHLLSLSPLHPGLCIRDG